MTKAWLALFGFFCVLCILAYLAPLDDARINQIVYTTLGATGGLFIGGCMCGGTIGALVVALAGAFVGYLS